MPTSDGDKAAGSNARRPWTEDENRFLRANWHSMPGDRVAQQLGRSFKACKSQSRRLGIGRYSGSELTLRALEAATGISRRQWQAYIDAGWLAARRRERRRGAAPITYVALPALHALLRFRPDVYDYQAAPEQARALLELDGLPRPPRWKRVTCHSLAWAGSAVGGSSAQALPAGSAGMVPQHEPRSCAALGGTSFWAALHAQPACPRCGCLVARVSVEGIYTDTEPGGEELIAIRARKLGLHWAEGGVQGAEGGRCVHADMESGSMQSGGRAANSAAQFARLLEVGLAAVPVQPVAAEELLDNVLDFDLRADQEAALREWMRVGAMTAAHAMGFGKSALGLAVLTRVAGRHLLVVDTQLNRDQWLDQLAKHAPRVEIRHRPAPARVEVTVFDRRGGERSRIVIVTYHTQAALEGEWTVACYDEVHRLPATVAHRLALVSARHRLALSSTPDLRADGRGVLVARMTGPLVGTDWEPQLRSGVVKRVPVRVLLVEDREHKQEVVGDLLRRHRRVAVLCEALQDGLDLEARYGIPFIHHRTRHKLAVLRAAPSVVMSRVGDAGISLPQCEVTVDHSGLFGSRIQSLQRLGRLMHSNGAQYHCILMTPQERGRFGQRVDIIRAKGFEVEERVVARESAAVKVLPYKMSGRVGANENPWLSLLGWRREEAECAGGLERAA